MSMVEQKLEELLEALKGECSSKAVRVSIEIDYRGFNTRIEERTPESLVEDCVSMRNLKGEFIK